MKMPWCVLCDLMAKVDAILEIVKRIDLRTENMPKSLDDIIDDVSQLKTKSEGLITLTNGIKAQLDAILAGALTPAQQAKVDQIFQDVEDQKTEVQAAIDANTPAA